MAHILIMEDDTELANLLAESIESAGHSVALSENATDALAHYKDYGADLLVADIIVKRNGQIVADGGVILTHRAKAMARQHGKQLPVIAISGAGGGRSGVDVLASARGVGADASLEKPFAPGDLLTEIDRQLGQASTD